MVQAFAILLACQLVGEGIVHLTGVPVPGPVLGLILLAACLWLREARFSAGRTPLAATPLAGTANGLLGHLSLLFVPAAVGVVQQGGVLARNGLPIVVALIASTVLTLAVTAAVFVWALRFVRGGDGA
ncbi:MAG: lrgA family protein [Enterovirga sp.]|jgi:holin-like protein|nr:lrgA family protein [Enterovirga sp.]